MSVPHWLRNNRTVIAECEWLVVGAGVTGLSVALALERAGESTLLLDRGAVGRGASTRNAGYLMRGAADNYALACDRYGRDRARQLWRLTEENLAALRELGVGSLHSYKPTPSCLLAYDEPEAEELRRSHELLTQDGLESSIVTSGEDAVWRHARPILGLLNPHDAACNPAELIGMLRANVRSEIRENTDVAELRARGDRVDAVVEGGVIRAARAIVCTNAYARELGARMPDVRPNRGQMIALRAPGRLLDLAYYSDHGAEYYRQPDQRTIVVGGCRKLHESDERTASDAPTHDVQSDLENFAAGVLGERLPVIARWAGVMGFTESGLPVVTATEDSRRIWFVGGMNGHGMSMAYRTSELAVAHMLGRGENPFPIGQTGAESAHNGGDAGPEGG